MKHKSNIVTVCLFIGVLMIFFLITLFKPAKEFSENENRYLQEKPSLSMNNLLDGSFMDDVNLYYKDQILFHDQFLSLKANLTHLLGYHQNNGVYYGDSGALYEIFDDYDANQLTKNIEAINAFTKQHTVESTIMLIPTANAIYKKDLPSYAPAINQEALITSIYNQLTCSNLDVFNPLMNARDQYLYYFSDHHWTAHGAFIAYQTLMHSKGKSVNLSDYEIIEKNNDFLGTLYSKVLDDSVKKDSIIEYQPKQSSKVKVTINDQISDHLYDETALDNKDKYLYYLGGNYPLMTIETSVNNNKSCLIIKDSYANCLIPFLAEEYTTIHVIDLRYFKQSINEFIQKQDIDEILFIYNLKSFVEETNFFLLNQ